MATRTISILGGDWDNILTWDEGAFPIAGDAVVARAGGTSGNVVVNVASACTTMILTNYTGTMTFNASLTVSGTITFVAGCTLAGTTGPLIPNATATLTSGGKTIPCPLTINTAATYTLADDWTVTGLVSYTNAGVTTLNGGGRTLICSGGLSVTASGGNVIGTAKIRMAGGTWTGPTGAGTVGIDVDLAGNVTVSGVVAWGLSGKTLKYVSGTITTTGSTLSVAANTTTFDTAGVTWNSVSFPGAGPYTFTTALAWSGTLAVTIGCTFAGAGVVSGTGAVTAPAGTLTLNNTGGLVTTGTMTLPNNACTFAGTAGFTVGTLTTATLTASRIYTLTFGRTYTVNTLLASLATSAARMALISSSPGNKVVFNLRPGATQQLVYCDPTDIDSSGGQTVVSVAGTITTSLNWVGSVPSGGGSPVTAYGFT